MAYTTPLTAVANAAFTAAQYNASDRDNMLVTPAALATTNGRFFAVNGANAIVERVPVGITNITSDTTTSTTYAGLTGGTGPAVTCTAGLVALVVWGVLGANSAANVNTFASYAVSGSTSIVSVDARSVGGSQATAGTTAVNASRVWLETALVPGSMTFTIQYRVSANTGTFSNRHISVVPF